MLSFKYFNLKIVVKICNKLKLYNITDNVNIVSFYSNIVLFVYVNVIFKIF